MKYESAGQPAVLKLRQAQPPPQSTYARETRAPIPKVEDLYSGGKTIDTVFPTYDKNKDVIIVGLDPGERVTVAACGIGINPDLVSQNLEEAPTPVSNLVVKRSALYQPILRHRLAMEALKTPFDLPVTLPQGAPPIAASSVVYPLVTSVLCHKAEKKPAVLFVYGSATFSTGTSLASLHTSFKSYFFKGVTALGYNVMSVDEFKTSSVCPTCDSEADKPTMRSCYCLGQGCGRYIHRDILGAHNIARVGHGYVTCTGRPTCLSRSSTGSSTE
ncbi:hypothetical protein BG006_000014 [Podila minutissima]|uniref:Cas12f1-like TNB domain-containing protein n=1 Tax=Podila minutissima TaxID=64525 RepID=A0A9P5VR95_9FUNG|nr:hypothetical protein BG006_000014 [Podila minutissima]